MLILNLASAELKKEIKLRHIYNLIKKMIGFLLIISIVTAVILLVARIILQNNFNKIVEETTLVTKNNQGYNNKIREINFKINYTSKIQDGFINWSVLIGDLAKLTPADITFNLVKISLEDKTIKIKGMAKSRESLLVLKQTMEKSPVYQELDFPLKNILEKNNIDFEINAKLNTANITY